MLFLRKKSKKERKEEIYTKFMENKKISKRDLRFMREIDWHPIDELELDPKTTQKLRKIVTDLKKGSKSPTNLK